MNTQYEQGIIACGQMTQWITRSKKYILVQVKVYILKSLLICRELDCCLSKMKETTLRALQFEDTSANSGLKQWWVWVLRAPLSIIILKFAKHTASMIMGFYYICVCLWLGMLENLQLHLNFCRFSYLTELFSVVLWRFFHVNVMNCPTRCTTWPQNSSLHKNCFVRVVTEFECPMPV